MKKNVVYDELNAIMNKHGHLTPTIVVTAAKDKKSPLHKHFEWNDTKAAAKYRLWQARQLIMSVEVIVRTANGDEKVRGFLNVGREGGKNARFYIPLQQAVSNAKYKQELLKCALMEIEYWRKQYAVLSSLRPIFKVVDSFVKNRRRK
jgi:hypothetical protein